MTFFGKTPIETNLTRNMSEIKYFIKLEVNQQIPHTHYIFGNIVTKQNFFSRVNDIIFTPQPLRAVGVLFSPMVGGWVGGGK